MTMYHKECVCIDCQQTYLRTGPAQKRCTPCAAIKQRERVRLANQDLRRRQGKSVGTGSGAHNTPGALHPQWKGGESKFVNVLAPSYYKKVRYCEQCGKDLIDAAPEFRAVHHKDHNRKNNVESNFELLCKRCHQVEHKCWKNLPNARKD